MRRARRLRLWACSPSRATPARRVQTHHRSRNRFAWTNRPILPAYSQTARKSLHSRAPLSDRAQEQFRSARTRAARGPRIHSHHTSALSRVFPRLQLDDPSNEIVSETVFAEGANRFPLRFDQSFSHGIAHELRTTRQAEFTREPRALGFDRLHTDAEFVSNLFVTQTRRDSLQHCEFTLRQWTCVHFSGG